MPLIKFFDKTAINEFTVMTRPGSVQAKNFNSIMFRNQGTATVIIKGVLKLLPGEAISLSQVQPNVGDETHYTIAFAGDSTLVKELVVITSTVND